MYENKLSKKINIVAIIAIANVKEGDGKAKAEDGLVGLCSYD